jgi:hypothetical protein
MELNFGVKLELFILLILITGCNSSDKCRYLIPSGFHGRVVIFFNQKAGDNPVFEDNYRLYDIPESGVLKTQFNNNDGFLSNPNENEEFYYLSKDGVRNKIPVKWDYSTQIEDSILKISSISTGIFEDKEYLSFYVSKTDSNEFRNGFKKIEWWNKLIKDFEID